MAKKEKPDLGAQYREAKDALPAHRKRWADAEQAHVDWLNAHRHVPSVKYQDPETGEPTDPELKALAAALERAVADDVWVRCVVVACGEAIKGGEPLEKILARQGQRPNVTAIIEKGD